MTSQKFKGDLNNCGGKWFGAEKGDCLCNEAAQGSGLPKGHYRAWLSGEGYHVKEILDKEFPDDSSAHFVLNDLDKSCIAANWNELVTKGPGVLIERDEKGVKQSGTVWTGSFSDGSPVMVSYHLGPLIFNDLADCADWSSSNVGRAAHVEAGKTGVLWSYLLTPEQFSFHKNEPTDCSLCHTKDESDLNAGDCDQERRLYCIQVSEGGQ